MNAVLNSLFTATQSPEAVRSRVTEKAIEVVRSIVSANQHNMAHYQTNSRLLDAGIFYPDDYYVALKQLKQQRRLDFLVQNNGFWCGYMPSNLFHMVPVERTPVNPAGFVGCFFVLNKGVLPSEALASLRQKTSIIGCGEVCQIAYYEAMRHLFGDEKFNALFSGDSTTPLTIGNSTQKKNPITFFLRRLPPGSPIKKGHLVQFKNAAVYLGKSIVGSSASYITLCVDDTPGNEKFTTLGLDSNGLTRADIVAILIKELNKPPLGLAPLSPDLAAYFSVHSAKHLEIAEQLKNMTFTRDQLNDVGDIGTHAELSFERIALLASLPTELACKALDTIVHD